MSRDYCDHLIDMLAPWGPVTARKMFGGFGLYRSGLMFAIVVDDALYFKVDDHNRADYEAAGCEPFAYEAKGRRVTLSYWQAPPETLDDEAALGECAKKAYAAAVRAQETKQSRAPMKPDKDRPISRMRSLGPKSAAWLKEAGIETEGDLRALGAVAAYRRAKARNPKSVSLNLLWGLHAVLEGGSWKDIDPATKARLKREAGEQ